MENKEIKFNEHKKKIIDAFSETSIIQKLKNNQELNRNFQFQIHLLLSLNQNDSELEGIINRLKNEDILIHFFNETISDEEIELLLELNNIKISKILSGVPKLSSEHLSKFKEKELKILERKELRDKYINIFENSKKQKWFKKISSRGITYAMFLAFITKIRDKKFKLLLDETIDNINQEYQLNIDKESPDEEFLRVFYEYVINSSVKKSLIIVLITLVAIFIAVLTTILVLTKS